MKRFAILLVLALLVAGCTSKPAAPTTPTGTNTTNSGALKPAVSVTVTLVDRQVPPGVGVPPSTMGIDPASLDLAVNVPVHLTVTNGGNSAHDLVIDGLDVKTDSIAPGESVNVEFTPTKAGTYKMYCDIGAAPLTHDAQGMHGEVTVA